jgi:uncharacterized protein (DUF1778 family)
MEETPDKCKELAIQVTINQTTIVLSDRDRDQFLDASNDSISSNSKLKTAFAKFYQKYDIEFERFQSMTPEE